MAELNSSCAPACRNLPGYSGIKGITTVTKCAFSNCLSVAALAAVIAFLPLPATVADAGAQQSTPRKAATPSSDRVKPAARNAKSAASKGSQVRVSKPAPRPQASPQAARPAPRATPASLRTSPDTLQSAQSPADLVLRSAAVLVMGQDSGQALFSRNGDTVRPIASITKLMTAMVVLDYAQPMDELITITEADIDATRRLHSRLGAGTTLSRAEMLRLSLMSSENRATAALARTSPGGYDAFIAQMNLKALALGMHHSRFEDSTGLNDGNVSTARELVLMVNAGLEYPTIRDFTTTSNLVLDTPGNRAAQLQFNNSNQLVARPEWEIGLSKTGFIRAAGRCLVMQARINGERMIIVLLDSDGRYSRIGDANRIRRWVESGFSLRLI